MEISVRMIFVVAVLIQFLFGIWVIIDANRSNRQLPVLYFYALAVPVVGLVGLLSYSLREDTLPQRSFSVPPASGVTGSVSWTIEHRGLGNLPRRLAYSFQDTKIFWEIVITVPPVLFALTVLLDRRFAPVLVASCILFLSTFLFPSNRLAQTTVELEPDAGRFVVLVENGGGLLSASGTQSEINLSDITRAQIQEVYGQPMIRFRYSGFPTGQTLLLISPEHLTAVRGVLSRHGIPLHDGVQEGTARRIFRNRIGAGVISLVVFPLIGGLYWPLSLSIQPADIILFVAVLTIILKLLSLITGAFKYILEE